MNGLHMIRKLNAAEADRLRPEPTIGWDEVLLNAEARAAGLNEQERQAQVRHHAEG